MTKLKNGVQFTNSFLSPEFAEYLISQGFACTVAKDSLYFEKNGSHKLYIIRNEVGSYEYNPQAHKSDADKWVYTHSFTGISQLNLFGFKALMHVMGVIVIEGMTLNLCQKPKKKL